MINAPTEAITITQKVEVDKELQSQIRHMIGYTHAGNFHADDVFSAALLKKIYIDIEFKRVFKAPTELRDNEIVFDIGGGEFDHHQAGAEVRPNGIKYAAFGLLWRAFGKAFFDTDDGVQMFDEFFVQPIDAQDNGQADPHTIPILSLSSGIGLFNPVWDAESSSSDSAFGAAVIVAGIFLERGIETIQSKLRARDIVYKAVIGAGAHGRIMVLGRFVPWQEWLFEAGPIADDILYVVFPSNRGGYSIQTVPVAPGSFQGRKMLPKEWWGKTPAELKELTGIETLRFVHANGFLAATDTLEDAMAVAKLAVNA